MSDERASTPVTAPAATHAEVQERCARTNTPPVAMIESNQFPKCEIGVQLLRFPATTTPYAGECSASHFFLCRVGGGLVDIRVIVLDA